MYYMGKRKQLELIIKYNNYQVPQLLNPHKITNNDPRLQKNPPQIMNNSKQQAVWVFWC